MDDAFTKLVDRCAAKRENHVIFNATREHALTLFEKLFQVALEEKEDVKIFSGEFEFSFYDKLVVQVLNLMNSGRHVDLIADCPISSLAENAFVKTVKTHKNGTVKCLPQKTGFPHFILVGNSRYRFETDDALKSARANFGDPFTGGIISEQFSKLSSAVQ